MTSLFTGDGRKLTTGNEPMENILGQVNPFMQEDTNNFDHAFWDKLIEDYA